MEIITEKRVTAEAKELRHLAEERLQVNSAESDSPRTREELQRLLRELELQAKLLRVIQEGEFERLGSPRTVKVDVRVITASNRNLTGPGMSGSWRVSSNER